MSIENFFTGNLLLLEGGMNSACNNRKAEAKVTALDMYRAISLCFVWGLAATCARPNAMFDGSMLATHSANIATQVAYKWPLRG